MAYMDENDSRRVERIVALENGAKRLRLRAREEGNVEREVHFSKKWTAFSRIDAACVGTYGEG